MPESKITKDKQPKCILGFDFGLRQIGVALLQRPIDIASPLTVIRCKNNKPSWLAIEKIITEWQPQLCVIGLPLNMDGSESDMSRRAVKFSNQLNGRHHVTTELQDERLTSFDAKQEMLSMELSNDYRNNPADSLAATLILEQWLALQ